MKVHFQTFLDHFCAFSLGWSAGAFLFRRGRNRVVEQLHLLGLRYAHFPPLRSVRIPARPQRAFCTAICCWRPGALRAPAAWGCSGPGRSLRRWTPCDLRMRETAVDGSSSVRKGTSVLQGVSRKADMRTGGDLDPERKVGPFRLYSHDVCMPDHGRQRNAARGLSG